ncbi:TonB-dependent receptor [Pelomonas sp. CA6]|uniref:TonB-dependent receptor domain-containing protein n=1 Tax=Pelomonas sp. CA6 TaxID=2907999 RepID=UPI001F4C01B2|nr:TonB-dependent receptor [Pelomonas sp. CA6]MCH7343355.1 TonB-dependent receptor [Pelomonas sp. CA6]
MQKQPLLRPLAVALSLALSSLDGLAQDAPPTTNAATPGHALAIPAQAAALALQQLIEQTGIQLVYAPELVQGLVTRAVNGHFTPRQALAQMLEGSELQAVETGENAWTLRRAPAAPAAGEERARLESVFVSASRRREPVREVPMQVSVMDAEQLGRGGARNLQDYLANESGVNVKSNGGPGMGTVSIRGITTGSQTISTVGVYVDEVAFGSSGPFALGTTQALDLGLLDLQHIEVLRGPQGTLYGAGAMGGLLKYVPHEPDTTEWSGHLTAGVSVPRGGGLSHTVGAVANLPLKSGVAGLRLSAFNEHAGGTIDAIGPFVVRANNNRGNTHGLRASLLLTPLNRLKLRLTGTTQTLRYDSGEVIDYRPDGRPLHGGRQRRLYEFEPYRIKIDLLSADVEYDFGWARFNAITSRQRSASRVRTDSTEDDRPILEELGELVRSVRGSNHVTLDKTTQELRLTSKSDKQLEWLLGLYWDDEKSTNDQRTAATMVDGTLDKEMFRAALPARYREIAVYGDLTWKFANGLAVTGGLRVARNRQHFTQSSEGLLAGGSQSMPGASSDTSRTWLLTARYALDRHSDVYLRGASGYRPGGPNPVVTDPVTGQPTGATRFGHDTLTNLELGYKAALLDQRLSVEAAVFDIRWKDLQQFKPARTVATIVNAGAARVRGVELSANWRPDSHWTLGGNAAYIDARLSEDAPGLDAAAGARLPISARFSASLSASYAFSLGGYPSYAGLTHRYVGARLTRFEDSSGSPAYQLPAYSLTDLQAGIDFKRVQLAFFVRNLFDREAQLSGYATSTAAYVFLEPPRTAGLTLTVPF